jgi:hypothetical protein
MVCVLHCAALYQCYILTSTKVDTENIVIGKCIHHAHPTNQLVSIYSRLVACKACWKMNQLTTFNNLNNDGHSSRRYAGYPLNSTLVSYFTVDTIRSIITHAATGKPYSMCLS